MDTDAFDLQEIKRLGQSILCFDNFYSLITAADIHGHLFVFHHYKWQSFEIGSSYSQTFALKTVHNTTLNTIKINQRKNKIKVH